MFFVTITDKTTKKQVVQKFPTKQQADKSAEAFRMIGYKVRVDN